MDPTETGLELEELQNPDSWDYAGAVKAPGRREGRRTVLSVAFSADSFQLVAQQAEQLDKRVSEFVRDAAVAAASPPPAETERMTISSSNSFVLTKSDQFPPFTSSPVSRLIGELVLSETRARPSNHRRSRRRIGAGHLTQPPPTYPANAASPGGRRRRRGLPTLLGSA